MTNQDAASILVTPFVVAIDTREQAPWQFTGLHADAKEAGRRLLVQTQPETLKTGDYSIVGLADQVAVERKSKEDLWGTIAGRRDAFEAEHERLSKLGAAAVIIECSLGDALKLPPAFTRFNPKSIHRTFLSWSIRYRVPWIWCDDRRLAEVTCFRFLQKFWESIHGRKCRPADRRDNEAAA